MNFDSPNKSSIQDEEVILPDEKKDKKNPLNSVLDDNNDIEEISFSNDSPLNNNADSDEKIENIEPEPKSIDDIEEEIDAIKKDSEDIKDEEAIVGLDQKPSEKLKVETKPTSHSFSKVLLAIGPLILLISLGISILIYKNNLNKEIVSKNESTIDQTELSNNKNPKPEIFNQINVADTEAIIATVGEENIYVSDFNYIYSSRYLDSPFIDKAIQDEINNYLIEQSLILQYAASQNWLQLDDDVFNKANKDYPKRYQLYQTALDKIRQQEKTVTFSVVSIWPQNVELPQIPLEEAQILAETKITDLHQKLLDGTLTMDQAGEMIKSDSELAKLDNNYIANAFSRYKDYKLEDIYTKAANFEYFTKLKEIFDQHDVNYISDVLHLRHEAKKENELTEEYYFIVKVESKSGNIIYTEFMQNLKNQFPINFKI